MRCEINRITLNQFSLIITEMSYKSDAKQSSTYIDVEIEIVISKNCSGDRLSSRKCHSNRHNDEEEGKEGIRHHNEVKVFVAQGIFRQILVKSPQMHDTVRPTWEVCGKILPHFSHRHSID